MTSFYCKRYSGGGSDLPIKEWNRLYNLAHDMNLTEIEKRKLLHQDECKEQCFDCMARVGDRRIKTKNS